MLQNRFLKENWDLLSVIVYYLGILIVAFSLFFNRYFLEKYYNHQIISPNPIYITQIIAFVMGFSFILFHLFKDRIKEHLKKLKHTPDYLYLVGLFLIFIIITLIIVFWQDSSVLGEGKLFNKISLIGYLTVAILSFANFLLLKNKHNKNIKSFYEKEKNFWIIFSIAFLLLAIIDYFDLHKKFQDWFISITNIPLNAVTNETQLLIPFAIIVITFFSIIFFYHKLKEHKSMLFFFHIGIIITIIVLLLDMILLPDYQIFIKESIRMLIPFIFLTASLIAVFDNL